MKASSNCPSLIIFAAYSFLIVSFPRADSQNTQVVKGFLRDKVNAFGYARFTKHKNTMLNVTAVSKGFVTQVGQCAYICANSSNGFSFNFVTTPDIYGRHICEIFATDKYRSQVGFICKLGVNHYSITSPCASFPCRNGGTCSPNYEEEAYVCLCKSGYDGQQCETPVDHVTDYALIGHTHKILTTSSMKDCFLACVGDCLCVAYQRSGTQCELMKKDRSMASSQFVVRSGYKYNELKQAYIPEKTPKGCTSTTCKNGCCAYSFCLNGGTCVESCSSLTQRFYCLCPRGFGGRLCDKPMTCAAHGKQLSSGMYSILTYYGQEINVYCDFTSTPGIVWSLIESCTLSNALTFQTRPLTATYPVNEALMNWQNYRQSYTLMQATRYNATLWRSTCNYHLNGYLQRDSIRGSLAYLDILMHTTGYLCVPVDFINVRGITCSSCTVAMYQDASIHACVDSQSVNKGCQWNGLSGASSKKIRGKWYYDTYFGNYVVYNFAFGCTSSSTSTTQWWLGTPV